MQRRTVLPVLVPGSRPAAHPVLEAAAIPAERVINSVWNSIGYRTCYQPWKYGGSGTPGRWILAPYPSFQFKLTQAFLESLAGEDAPEGTFSTEWGPFLPGGYLAFRTQLLHVVVLPGLMIAFLGCMGGLLVAAVAHLVVGRRTHTAWERGTEGQCG
jgi:hypothetical protein